MEMNRVVVTLLPGYISSRCPDKKYSFENGGAGGYNRRPTPCVRRAAKNYRLEAVLRP